MSTLLRFIGNALRTVLSAHSFLFLYSVLGAFFAFLLLRVFAHWTGNIPTWPILVPSLLLGGIFAGVLSRWVANGFGARCCAWMAVLLALFLSYCFANTAAVVETWRLISWRNDLTYALWFEFILRNALLWFVPIGLVAPILWARNEVPRGKLTVFCGGCCGIILARLFVGYLPTLHLVDICLGGMLVCSFAWVTVQSKWLVTRLISLFLLLLFGLTYYVGTVRSAQDLLNDFHPFAYIAQRDSRYIGNPEGFVLREGRIVQVKGLDEASRVASQMLPLLFKPTLNARIAARPQWGQPAFAAYDCAELKGKYDALWIELPPAWLATEQDYFGTSALTTIKDHLHEDGLLVYDFDARAMDGTMLRIRAHRLRNHFAHTQLWMTGLNRWQLVASQKPIETSLSAIDSLMDREDVRQPLRAVNMATPITTLASNILADTAILDKDQTPQEGFRFMERRFGRRALFDPQQGRRLIAQTLPHFETSAPWVKTAQPIEAELVEALRQARKLTLEGTLAPTPKDATDAYREASMVLAQDAFLLGLADHEYATARDWEALARNDVALQIYANTISYVQPTLPIVLHAATLAYKNNYHALAEDFFRIAEDLAPNNLTYLKHYANFLREAKQFKAAEEICLRILRVAAEVSPEDLLMARFYLGVCIAQQPNRKDEGLAVLEQVVRNLKTQAEKDAYIPAYGQFLIDMGKWQEGLEIRRYYQEHGSLKP